MRFMAIQCNGPTQDMNWLTVLTANARLILILTIVYMSDSITILYRMSSILLCTFPNSSSQSLNNMDFTLNGISTSLHFSMLNRLRISSMCLFWLMVILWLFFLSFRPSSPIVSKILGLINLNCLPPNLLSTYMYLFKCTPPRNASYESHVSRYMWTHLATRYHTT